MSNNEHNVEQTVFISLGGGLDEEALKAYFAKVEMPPATVPQFARLVGHPDGYKGYEGTHGKSLFDQPFDGAPAKVILFDEFEPKSTK